MNTWLQMNGEARSNMAAPDSEEADTSCSDLTVLGCVQGEADLPEMSNIGPSAWLPPGSLATFAPPCVPW